MSSTASPNTSPWRRPSPEPNVTQILYWGGSASCMEETHSDGQGTTLRRDVAGLVTELALHGFLAIMSSSTAAEKMADTLEKITRR